MQQTIEYDQFKSITSNREVDRTHVKKLVKAISKKNLLHLNPILCNKNLEVIDGQHRLEAAKQLLAPIFFVIDDEITKEDIASINSNSKNWSIMDYINYWAVEKRPGFDRLSSFLAENPKINASTAVWLLSVDGARNTEGLRNGEINISNHAFAKEVAKLLKFFRNHFEHAYDRNFIRALVAVMSHEDYSEKIIQEKVLFQPRSLVRCISQKQYSEMILEIYNYKSSKNRLSIN